MAFDQREWVNDIVVGAITGVVTGVVSAMVVPSPPFANAALANGLAGFVVGILTAPLKALLNRRSPS